MTADGRRAHEILLGFEPLTRYGACWYYVWQAYAQAGAWTDMGSTPTAYEGWNATSGKHPGDRNPPYGAAIWLGRRYDGNMDGDVFIAGPVDGDHSATDQANYGYTGWTSIQARMDLCGREYLGWTDHVMDCPIDLHTPQPQTEDEEMPIGYVKLQGKSGARRGGVYAIVSRPGAKPKAVFIGDAGETDLKPIADDGSISELQSMIDGLA